MNPSFSVKVYFYGHLTVFAKVPLPSVSSKAQKALKYLSFGSHFVKENYIQIAYLNQDDALVKLFLRITNIFLEGETYSGRKDALPTLLICICEW